MRSSAEIEIELPALAPTPERVGRYRICGELASGGMASVYLGVSEGDTQPGALSQGALAIKRVHPHLARQREFVEMFVDEARIASRIRHPNVCSVLEWGESEGTFFLVMELLEGEPLVTLLRRVKKSPEVLADPRWPRCAARIIADACGGLHAAHDLADDSGEPMQVVHRDVSPHNLFVTWEGVAKVVDFGVASAKHRLHQTTTGTVKGKFAYMAPEQLQGSKADRRADVWSLGVVLWELIAARALFRRAIETETIFAVLEGAVPALASARAGTPSALDAIVRRALAQDVAKRTPTAQGMRDELEAWLASEGGFTTHDVRAMIDELLPGERVAHHARTQRAIAGGTSIVPRAQPEPTPPTGAPRSGVLRRGGGKARLRRALGALAIAGMVGASAAVGAGWGDHGAGEAVGTVTVAEAPSLASPDAVQARAAGSASARAPASAPPTASDPASAPPSASVPASAPPTASVPASAPTSGRARDSLLASAAAPGAVAVSRSAVASTSGADPASTSTGGAPAAPAVMPDPEDTAAVRAGARRAARALATARSDPDDDGSGVGSLDVSTPGGWAEVWLAGRRLGHTPSRFELPVGRHTLLLRAGAGGAEQRVPVRIVGGQLARVRVDLDR